MKKHMLRVGMAVMCSGTLAMAWGQSSGDLTISGAEKAASQDGAIPAYSGQDAPLPGWSQGKQRGDFWKYKDEKPLLTITEANLNKYSDKLTPGQLALFKQIKGYQMDVFPTHRNCGYPDFVRENTIKNKEAAKLDATGDHLQTAVMPGLPFPAAKSGQEAIWNYLSRYRGVGIRMAKMHTVVSPRPGGSDWIDEVAPETLYFPWGKKGSTVINGSDSLFSIYFNVESPAALAGQAMVQTYYFANSDAPAYYYFPGQRRVRRLPSYNYDAPQIGFENQYAVDEPWLFNGDIDRFNWKLVGKKAIYVPYNDFGMYDFKKNADEIRKPDHIDPSARRYELHRVYVVEATLKPNMRHASQKKVFYLDEDTYLILAAEDYDGQGKLWKTKESYPIPVWELGGSCDVEPFTQYNLTSGRYVNDQSVVGAGVDFEWFGSSSDSRFSQDYYTAENLRSMSER